jgi:hypothetical protein
VLVAPAYALRPNVYVASYGVDSGNCSFTAPCRTFTFALGAVQAGGVVTAIDSAGNSPVTINKAVTIAAPPGVSPSIVVSSGGTAVIINALPTDKVVLRGLVLDGQGIGGDGIDFNSGGALTIEDTVVRNFGGEGLHFVSTAATDETLDIANSSFSDNGANGIVITTENSGGIYASIDGARLHGNTSHGLYMVGDNGGNGVLYVTVTNSVASNNLDSGFRVDSAPGSSPSNLFLTRTVAEGNSTGIVASETNAIIWLAQSTIGLNRNYGFYLGFGAPVINSYGDNYIGNAANNGSLTPVPRQ